MSAHTIVGSRKNYLLSVDVFTSIVQQHSSFDYESMTNEFSQFVKSHFTFTLSHKYIYILRHELTLQTSFLERESLNVEAPFPQDTQLLAVFQVRYIDHNIILRFYEVEDLQSDKKYGVTNTKNIKNKSLHQVYHIVRSRKNEQNQSIGYNLKQGGLLKIGQKEYFISSVCSQSGGNHQTRNKLILIDNVLNKHKKVVISPESQKGQCKYCMQEQGEEEGQFLCSPCKCSGSCALVHFNCLEKWNQSKVKKNQVKGLTYYNFEKFCCEVCKEQYPILIEKDGKSYQLMPIEMPKGQHIILQQVGIKLYSLICIENIPHEGIRLGRGNECQIRIESPSISRNHARICKMGTKYYIFDNKSKFGTTVRDNKIYLQLDLTKKGIQIDRTVLMMQLVRKNIFD